MIVKLILNNLTQLLSSGISSVELDLDQLVNIFIAKNGTGKSSILAECNPWPAEASNYTEGGKYIEIRENGKIYKLESVISGSGNEHTFTVDGENLNKNRTYQSQKELVERHFNISPNLTRFSSGLRMLDLFSYMTASRRKDLLMEIYPNDTQYLMSVYEKLKQERNDLKGAIKNQVIRHTEEVNKLKYLNENGTEHLESRIKSIEGVLREALLIRGSFEGVEKDPNLDAYLNEFKALTDELTVSKLMSVSVTKEELENKRDFLCSKLHMVEDLANTLKIEIATETASLEGYKELIKDPELLTREANDLTTSLAIVESDLVAVKEVLANHPVFINGEYDLTGLDTVAKTFSDYLHKVSVTSDETITSSSYQTCVKNKVGLVERLNQATETLSTLQHKINHYDGLDNIDCPKCDHTFKVGVTKEEVALVRNQIPVLEKLIDGLREEIRKLDKYIDDNTPWYDSMLWLHQFAKNSGVPMLGVLIKEYDVGKVHPESLQNALGFFLRLVRLEKDKDMQLKELNALNERLDFFRSSGLFDDTIANIKKSEEKLSKSLSEISELRVRIEVVEKSISTINNYNRKIERLKHLSGLVLTGLQNSDKVNNRAVVDKEIARLTIEKETALTDIIKTKSIVAIVDSISDDIEHLKDRLAKVEILIKTLCPNKGYIGKLMSEFIETICGNVNAILEEVWDTTLYIKPCSKDNGDLTYKFPVVTGTYKPTPDILECSMGEREVINWAFRLVIISNYINFDLPLVMDEVGTNFDEIKRSMFGNYIRDYVKRSDSKQLLVVSHFLPLHGFFSKPNIIAFNHTGLTISGDVNQNTKVK